MATDFNDDATREGRRAQGKVLVDGLALKNLDTKIVDLEKLKSRAFVTRKPNREIRFTIVGGDDALFGRFDYNVANRGALEGSAHRDRLQTHVVGKPYANLVCDDVSGIVKRLDSIKAQLMDDYGIQIDYSSAKIQSIEIAKTIHLQHGGYADYHRVLALLMSLIPEGHMDYVMLCGRQARIDGAMSYADIRTHYRMNSDRTLQVKFYDKTQELLDRYGIEVADDFLRCELTLKGRKVRQWLKLDLLKDLTDADITNSMQHALKILYRNTFERWELAMEEWAATIFQDEYGKDSRHFIRRTLERLGESAIELHGTPFLLSSYELCAALTFSGLSTRERSDYLMRLCREKYTRFSDMDRTRAMEVLGKLYNIFDIKSV